MNTPRHPDPADDPERDAWLSQALRHAPDAQAAPPPALSESILRQARAATRHAAALRPRRNALGAAWAWLVRPPVAAGFASLLVATTVGLMWWDRPMDETLARPPVAAPSPAPSPAAVPVPPAETAPPPAEAVTPPPAAVPSETPTVRKPPASRPAPRAESTRQRAAAAPEPAPAAVSPAPAPAPLPSPSTPTSDSAAAELRDTARPTDSAPLARSASKAAPPAAALTARLQGDREPRPPALAALLDSVVAQPERWRWQRSGASQPMNPALQRWLLQLDDATAARWRSTADPAAPPAANGLRLYRDGTLTATLSLTDDAVWLAPASQAALPAASIAALRQALDDATP